MADPTRACADCGADISTRQHNALRCVSCATCRAPWDRGKRRTQYDHTCQLCGHPYRSRVKGQRYCSGRCGGKASSPPPPTRPCPACGAEFTGWAAACSRPCCAWTRRHPNELIPTVCGWCAGSIVGRQIGSLYCSSLCARLTMCGRRRANRNGQPVHRIRPSDIFERDKWTCHICAEPIDRTLRGRTPGSPALDHLIPISHADYPGHLAANLAAAHWSCNNAKGKRMTDADLALHLALLAALPPGEPAKRHAWSGPGPRTHCINGHEFTEENTYWRPDGGGRQCRQCTRDRARVRNAAEEPSVREARLTQVRARYGSRAA